ncbi:MAG: hypothetical protein H6Q13_1200 [Bacteroidetes bacterium]|nr:hypothetical protein [Bacteroidota bacterium]
MKRYKLIYLLLLLLLLPLGSCEREDDDFLSTADYTTVNFQVPSLSVSADTRATAALSEGTKVTVYAYEITDGNESDEYTQSKAYTVNASGTLVADDGEPMALFSALTYKFYAVSPAHSFLDGSQKQFGLENSYTADFKVSSMESTLSSSTATLTFDAFRLEYSAIRLALQRDANATSLTSITPDADKSGVSFTELTHSPYTYTLGDEGIDGSSSEVDGSLEVPVAAITEVTANTLYTAFGYVLPKKSAPFRITAYVTANGSTASTFSAEVPAMTFLAGKKYLFTVVFSDPMVYLTLKVTDWDGVSTSGNVGGDEEGLTVEVGGWSTDGWDSGTIGTGNSNTILVGSWAVSPDAWSTGDLGTGESNVLHVGDWNGTSWGTGNVATDEPNTVTNSGSWSTTTSWSSTDTGAGNGDNTLDGSGWSSGSSWSTGNVATDEPNTVTNSGSWSTTTPWNSTDTGAGNGDNSLDGSGWSSGSWSTGNVATDEPNTVTNSGSWSTTTPWNSTDTGAGNGDNTLDGSGWSSGSWSTGNVATDEPNTVTNSGSWSTTTPWNSTDTGGSTNGNNTLGTGAWTLGTWGTGSTGTDQPNTVITTPWDSTTNDMGNMGSEP